MVRSRPKSYTEPPEQAVKSAVYGLRYGAEQGWWSLSGMDVERLAQEAVRHALTSVHVVTRAEMDDRVEEESQRAQRYLGWWSALSVEADRQRVRMQAALIDLRGTHPEQARRVAEAVGVILYEEPAPAARPEQLPLLR